MSNANASAGDHGDSLLSRFPEFLHKWRVVIWGLLAAIVVFLAAYFVYEEVRKNRTEQATMLAEEAATHLSAWVSTDDEDEKSAMFLRFSEKIDLILGKYPRLYAAQRALYLRAQYFIQTESWEQAVDPFLELADRFPSSYLAPLSLFNAAVCLENADDATQALAAFTDIADGYPGSYLAPHALFSMGRIHESLDQETEAVAAYTRLEDDHPSSTWTQLAKNRIIAIELRS